MMVQDKNVPVDPPFLFSPLDHVIHLPFSPSRPLVILKQANGERHKGRSIFPSIACQRRSVLMARDRQGPFRFPERMAALMLRLLWTTFSSSRHFGTITEQWFLSSCGSRDMSSPSNGMVRKGG